VENYALSDHLPTFAVRKYFKQSKSTNSHDSITYRDLKNLNISAFKNMLANSPWDTAFVFDDINDVLATWEGMMKVF
jgi:hypothetical protein